MSVGEDELADEQMDQLASFTAGAPIRAGCRHFRVAGSAVGPISDVVGYDWVDGA